MKVLGLLLPLALLLAGGTPDLQLACRMTPRVIEAGAFYDGATVRVDGTVEAGSQVLITVTGPEAEEHFNLKGRWGPIWINSGKVRISGVPSLFLRFSSQPVDSLLDRDSISRYVLDRESLMGHVRAAPHSERDARIRSDYLALREADNTYAFHASGVTMKGSNGNGGPARFALEFRWPKKAPPAAYEVHVYEVRERAIVRDKRLPLQVVRVGFPEWLADIAHRNGSLYGMVAVFVGALAGFGIDQVVLRIFGKKRTLVH